MRRIKIEILLTAIGCILIGIALLAVMAWNYREFLSLPPLSANKATLETLRGMILSDMKLIAMIGAVWMLFGISLCFSFFKIKKHDSA